MVPFTRICRNLAPFAHFRAYRSFLRVREQGNNRGITGAGTGKAGVEQGQISAREWVNGVMSVVAIYRQLFLPLRAPECLAMNAQFQNML